MGSWVVATAEPHHGRGRDQHRQHHTAPPRGEGLQARQDGPDDRGGGEGALSQVKGTLPPAAHPSRAGSSFENLWRHSRPVHRSTQTLRIRWIPSRSQLSFPWRLRRQGEAESGDNLLAPCLQNQVSRELFSPERKSRMCFYKQNIWLL